VPRPVAATRGEIAFRGGSPRDRAVPRGGSPRDRYIKSFGQGVADQALSYRGMPYIRGASSPARGFDCSGLVYYVLRHHGLNPPRTAAGYRNYGTAVAKKDLQTGDILLFANTYKRGISHVGVYMGNGKFVHAATSGTGVRVSSLNEAYYTRKYYGARRIK
jgi:cell wall-associated NlpC family hydrolase